MFFVEVLNDGGILINCGKEGYKIRRDECLLGAWERLASAWEGGSRNFAPVLNFGAQNMVDVGCKGRKAIKLSANNW